MAHTIHGQPGFVLHTRPYRETSLLVTLFTREYGRVDAIARAVRTLKSPLKGLLQPFQALKISWSGRGELVTVKDAELSGEHHALDGERIPIGFYLNELLNRLLAPFDSHANLYLDYQTLIDQLRAPNFEQRHLRFFEMRLLSELGFGLNCERDCQGQALDATAHYHYQPEQGFLRVSSSQSTSAYVFQGDNLLALAGQQPLSEQGLQEAKRLLRLAISHLLQYKPLRSRDIYHLPSRSFAAARSESA